MIQHVALSINERDDLENFYMDVLMFHIHYQFTISRDIAKMIFDCDRDLTVVVMRKDAMEFELFLSDKIENKVFSHVCISVENSKQIMERAELAGYKTVTKSRKDGYDTFFIWDKSANLFEIKEKQA